MAPPRCGGYDSPDGVVACELSATGGRAQGKFGGKCCLCNVEVLQTRVNDGRLRKILLAHLAVVAKHKENVADVVVPRVQQSQRESFGNELQRKLDDVAAAPARKKRRCGGRRAHAAAATGDDGVAPQAPALVDPSELWRSICEDISCDAEGQERSMRELKNYSAFTASLRAPMEAEQYPIIELPIGPVGGAVQQLVAYLSYRRYGGGPKSACTTRPLTLRALLAIAAGVRAGAAEYEHVTPLPRCLRPQEKYTSFEKKQFAYWKREDERSWSSPAPEQVYLTGEQIQDYCIVVCAQLASGAHVSDDMLLTALLVRFQSATNVRAGNLEYDLRWEDVHEDNGPGLYGRVSFINTKRVSAAAANVAKVSRLRAKVDRYIDDDVSGTLFKEYNKRNREGRAATQYFFPAAQGDAMEWDRPMSNKQHNKLIQRMVAMMGYATEDRVLLYTSTSIRRGNQALTEVLVQKFRAQRNHSLGWASGSQVPEQHYAPEAIVLAPGPLFWDIESINVELRATTRRCRLNKFSGQLCTECAFPFKEGEAKCWCTACVELSESRGSTTKPKRAHNDGCWRKGARRHGQLPQDIRQKLFEAWRAKGCRFKLEYDANCGYKFTEEEI